MSEYYTWEFGPSFDRNRTDVLPVAYVAVPKLNSERGVTKIAADRLFPGNYLHQERIDLSSIVSPTVSLERILLQVQSSGAVFGGERVGNFQNTLRFEKYGTSGLEKTDPFAVDIINHPIKISGIEEDTTGRWRVLTTPGSLCRKTSFRSTEPADSWLRKTNLAEGQALYLLYGIPEYWYGPTYGNFNSLTWGSSDFSAVLKTEVLNPTTSHSFNLHFTPVIGIEAVWVNGTFWTSGFWDGSQDNSIFLSIDQDEGTINFKRSFAPTDELTVQYYTPRIDYSYGGFYHPLSGYFHLDLNPEEGHYTRDPGNGYYYPTRDILANGIQLYLTPCAAFTLSGDLVLGETSYTPIQLQTLSGSGLRSFRFNSILHDEFYQSGLPLHGGNTTGYWAHLEAPTSGSVITQIYQNYTLPTEHFDRIIGYLQVKYSGNYRFKLMHDDGVRMWIREPNDLPPQGDDPTSIDSWWHSDWVGQGIYPNTPAAAFADTNTVAHIFTKAMVSGTLYPIRLEWYNHTNESELSFLAALGSSSSFSIFSSGSFHDPLARDDQFLFNTITNTYIATGDLQYYSAFDYGETHFLRYRLGGHNDESIYDETAPANDTFSQETWGYGICGRAHYRDYSTNEASWNSFYPSSIALGRLMAAPPLNVETVRIADARVRGGGISEPLYDFYSQVGSGLVDRVSGFWDMSLWEGPTVKEGGSVSVTLPGDLLTTYSESEVRELVMKRIPPGIELLLSFTPATSAAVEVAPEPDHIPHAPTLLVATAISSAQVDLIWTDNSTDENGFMIYRAQLEGIDVGPFRFLADTEAGVTSYQDTELTKETRYYYRILAFNDHGYSDYSNTAYATTPGSIPLTPTTLVATTASVSQIDLTWVDNSNNEQYFELRRAVGTPDIFALYDMVNSDFESYSDTGCDADTTYYYKIRALGSAGNSDYSNVANATTSALPTTVDIPLIFVPAGSFWMGNSGAGDDYSYAQDPYYPSVQETEFPYHDVSLSAYWIGKYEITRGEYRKFIDAGGYTATCSSYWSTAGLAWIIDTGKTEPTYWAISQTWVGTTFTQTDNHPVVGISWYEADAFCRWAGGRLPTEAEWEKAARGTDERVYPWSSTWNPENSNSNLDSSIYYNQTAPVGSFLDDVSPYGCYDMAGNADEWCSDNYSATYYSTEAASGLNPQGPVTGTTHVQKGGNWLRGSINAQLASRAAFRSGYIGPTVGYNLNGFRIVFDV